MSTSQAMHPPTRGEQIARCFMYLFTSVIGFYVVLVPSPNAIENRLGVVAFVWGLFMVSAVPAALATLVGRYRLECILIPLFGSALLVAVVNAWFGTVPDDPSMIPRVAASTALCFGFLVRWLQIHRIMRAEPWITTGH